MLFQNLFRKKNAITNDLKTPLLRCLNLFDLILLSVSGMVGSGIYVLTGVVAKDLTGPAIIISNLLAGCACLLGALCYAEFAARIPRAGSSYIFIYESIGEIVAFLVGFTSIVGGLTSLGVSARVWSAYFDALFNNTIHSFIAEHIIHWPDAQAPFSKYPDLLAFGITMIVILAMLSGLKNSKYLTNSLTVVNMSALFFIGITGFVLGNAHNYQPFIPYGVSSIFRGSSLLLYSYIGFEMATIAIEEAKNPSKIVPQATVISLLIVTSLYSLAGASLTYLIPYNDINSESSFAHAYSLSKWPWASYIISIAIVFSAGGNLLSGTYGCIRIIYAMSTDGLLPSKLSSVSEARHVPVIATCSACFIIALLATFFDIKDLIGFADISALLSYTGVSMGLLIERYDHHMPYKILLTQEENVEEEMSELNNDKDDNQDMELNNIVEHDPFLTRVARSLCGSRIPLIDSYLSPKSTAIVLLLMFIPSTSVLATMTIHILNRNRLLHIVIIVTCLLVNVMITFVFCLMHPKKQIEKLLFTCPGIPIVPLININIFIFLMVFQDAHDWFAYACIIVLSLFIYCFYSYRHSKAS
ncbi:unnamed protein product [Rotaria magnacalcarata]|uniref:Cationic amino acid transporter C-terminal domain-containing protein n=1 Tax=Rotaria magnacalcarata TaxID=392030 RepID=A0A816ZK48_9BILA|nr:unnamed protein product [Rotaria magnacalcarata]CAF2217710.1 unnamed protein product [Rotaria magnacalcarata]